MTTCPHCGSQVAPGQPVCTECRRPIPGATAPGESAAPTHTPKTGDALLATAEQAARTEQGTSPPGSPPKAPQAPRRDKSKDFALVGKTVADRYKVLDVLGQGGFGTVYLVEITAGMVGEKLALKILPEDLSGQPAFHTQFLNEIRVAMRLVDRCIVQIRDVGTTDEGLLYYTMDFCPGTTLAKILRKEGRIPITRALLLVLNVLRALQTAHALGIVHRDLKPANIMVEDQGGKETVRVLDFGIATAVATKGQKGLVGSPPYMPPEQFLGTEIGFYTDLYSVGVVLYECITGQKPYPGTSPQEVFKSLKTRSVTPPQALAPEVDNFPGLSETILKCLERNPERRHQSAKELFDQINSVLLRGTTMERPPGTGGPPRAAARAPAGAQPAQRIPGRRHRGSPRARRSSLQVGSAVLGLFIVAGVVLGVLFHKEIIRWWQSLQTPPATPETPTGKAAAPGKEGGTTKAATPQKTPGDQKAVEEQPIEDRKQAAQAELVRHLSGQLENAIAAKDWATAFRISESLLKIDDKKAETYRLRGLAALRMADFPSAETALERARELLTEEKVDVELLRDLAEAKLGLVPPKIKEAEALAAKLVGPDCMDPALILVLARIYEGGGKTAELKQLLASARERKVVSAEIDKILDRLAADEMRARNEKAARLLADARQAAGKGNLDEAARLAVESTRAMPSVEADLLAAESYAEIDDVQQGAGFVAEALERARKAPAPGPDGKAPEPPSAEAVPRLEGLLEYFSGKKSLAEYVSAGESQAELLKAAEGSFLKSMELLKKTGVEDRVALRLRFGLARVRALGGDVDRTVEALTPISTTISTIQDPAVVGEVSGLYLEAAEHARSDDKKTESYELARKALGALVKDLELPENVKARENFRLGLSNARLGGLTGKKPYFRQAIDSFSTAETAGLGSVDLYENWAYSYDQVGNLIRAAQCFRKAYEAEPTAERCLKAVDAYLKANPGSEEAKTLLKEGKVRFKDNEEIQKR